MKRPGRRKGQLTRVLVWDDRTCVLDQETWAEILLFLQKWGWKPEQLSTNYLAPGVRVSEEDAANIAKAGERIFEAATADPFGFHCGPVNLGKLGDIAANCRKGGFLILVAK